MSLNTYRIVMRKLEPPGTLEMFDDFCQAATVGQAKEIFEQRHGRGFIVAGPYKVDSQQQNNQQG